MCKHMKYKTKFIISVMAFLLIAGGFLTLPAAIYSSANAAWAQSEVPLVVVRFNQRRVNYDRQLYYALSKAVEIKPTLHIDLISYIPEGADSAARNRAAAQLDGMLASLHKMGVPRSRIETYTEPTGALRFHEIHMYVE